MTPIDLITMLVLSEISDDYESFENTYSEVVALGEKFGLKIRPLDVRNALTTLIESGLAKAYRLSTQAPAVEIPGIPLNDDNDIYYWTTDRGKIQLLAWSESPTVMNFKL